MATRPRRGDTFLGIGLVLVGALFLLGQLLHLDFSHYGWPFFIILPGIGLFLVAVMMVRRGGQGLAVSGSVVTVTGLVLLVQDLTDDYESWAYAWALVFPGAVGLGLVGYGLLAGRPQLVRPGVRTSATGLVLFLVAAIFFEGVVGISGRQFGRTTGIVVSVLVIAIGAALLATNLISRGRTDSR
jgi:peptidoglycan/LPS O-acetylase OafA/YrhL